MMSTSPCNNTIAVFNRFPLVLEQLLAFELAMSLELVTLRKLNGQPLRHLWSKVVNQLSH